MMYDEHEIRCQERICCFWYLYFIAYGARAEKITKLENNKKDINLLRESETLNGLCIYISVREREREMVRVYGVMIVNTSGTSN